MNLELNPTRVFFEDFNVVVKCGVSGYPILSGIDTSYNASCLLKNISVRSDIPAPSLIAPPTSHISFGIAMPKKLAEPHCAAYDRSVSGGFQNGIIFGEHTTLNCVDV